MRLILPYFLISIIALGINGVGYTATKIAFVTSTQGSGNLDSWPEILALPNPKPTGLAAGDKICQIRAAAANLPEPQTFVAWLSDENSDAYCRVFGNATIKGKRWGVNTVCEQSPAPTGAGPWMRVDGEPFADKIELALTVNNERVFTPLNRDEFGQEIPLNQQMFTATSLYGTFLTETSCNGWTSADINLKVIAGGMGLTGIGWTNDVQIGCHKSATRLICLQSGLNGDPLPNKTRWGHRGAFLTASVGSGKLSTWQLAEGKKGIAAGDAVCQKEATDRGFYQPKSYKAYLSDSVISAIQRFQHDAPWIRPDGLIVANGIASLASSSLSASALARPLNVNSNGAFRYDKAWTGTSPAGTTILGQHCNNWDENTASFSGNYGRSEAMNSHWVNQVSQPCNIPLPLYCFSDADVIFWSGFQTPTL